MTENKKENYKKCVYEDSITFDTKILPKQHPKKGNYRQNQL